MHATVFAVVVTYNRRNLLEKCLAALKEQSQPPQRTIIIDNASTDGTEEWLRAHALTGEPNLVYVRMNDNLGGAGGFAEGLQQSIALGADWIWMMDDDAEPEPEALEHLMNVASQTENVYGSLATSGTDTAWPTTLIDDGRVINRAEDVPEEASVQFLPFLGFLIHRSLVQRIGLPDKDYFIAADDVEYCLRAKQTGAEIVIAGHSRIGHPKARQYIAKMPGRDLICLRLPPWKRYYDTRNRLLIARKYYGSRLLTQTIPGSFVRLLAALRYEPSKLAQIWAFIAGFVDGLFGLKGRRHSLWHLS